MACETASWLPFVQPFATILIGIGAGFIAYRQWRTAANKVRLDMFTHRLDNYNRSSDILNNFCGGQHITDIELYNIFDLHRASPLFFDAPYVDSLGKCIDFMKMEAEEALARKNKERSWYASEIRKEQKQMWKSFVDHAGLAHIK